MSVDIKAIMERANAATPGPWEVGVSAASSRFMQLARMAERLSHSERQVFPLVWVPEHPDTRVGTDPQRPEHAVVVCDMGNGPTGDANGEFIAHARNDVPTLCAEVERLRAEAADCAENHYTADEGRALEAERDAARAEVARLREALEQAAIDLDGHIPAVARVNAALATTDNAAWLDLVKADAEGVGYETARKQLEAGDFHEHDARMRAEGAQAACDECDRQVPEHDARVAAEARRAALKEMREHALRCIYEIEPIQHVTVGIALRTRDTRVRRAALEEVVKAIEGAFERDGYATQADVLDFVRALITPAGDGEAK